MLLSTLSYQGFTQQINAEATLDTNSILIGDQVNLRLKLQIPENYPFRWPLFEDTLTGKVEIVKKSNIDTTSFKNGYLSIDQVLTLTVFDSGYYVIPPIRFFHGNSLESATETEPHLLNVFTVEVDTTQAIKPIKGPIAAPLTFAEILPWLIILIFIILASGFLIYYLKKKKKQEPVIFKKSKPKLPAHQIALAELEKLKNEKLWQSDRIKEYHSRLTDILREYIEHTFNIRAIEMTTWEIIISFSGAKIERKNLENLRQTLELADLVKFAKLKPTPDEHENSMMLAVNFVRQTTLKIAENPQANHSKEKIIEPEVVETK